MAYDFGNVAVSTKKAREILDVPEHNLRYWDKQGIVKPSRSPAAGRGSRRMYSYADLLALAIVKQLKAQGISLAKIRNCVMNLRTDLRDVSQPLPAYTLVAGGDTILRIKDGRGLIDAVRRHGQRTFSGVIVDVIDRELRQRVVLMAAKRIEDVTVGEYTYQVEVEPDLESGGYVAEVAGLPGCITQAESLDELQFMIADAIDTYLSAVDDFKAEGVTLPIRRRRAKRKRTA